jgi:hypothetical protein
MSTSKLNKAINNLVNELPVTPMYPRNTNKYSEQDIQDKMRTSNMRKAIQMFITSYRTNDKQLTEHLVDIQRHRDLLTNGEQFNAAEKAELSRKIDQVKQLKSYIADWTESIAVFEGLAEEYGIEIKDKPIKTSAQFGVELSDKALMEELKSI